MIDNTTFGTRTALFHTLGCKLNFSETSSIAKMLADRGIRRAHSGEIPDVVVINTCSVTELADKKSRQTIRSFHRRYPEALIIATGCYAQLKSAEAVKIDGVAIVAGNDQKDLIADYIDQWIEGQAPKSIVTPTADMRRFIPSCSRGDRTRYFLKVQDGCDYYCTYCTIPMARGRSRSGTIADIVAQAREVAQAGGREIVITGVNIGDFGKRNADGHQETFYDLIRELDRVEGIERYRISSIEPNLLSDEIIDFVARSRAFMPHFHIPLQSGSDTVLTLMRRHYDTSLFRHKIERIKEVMPDAFIGVDLIVGARGETESEFNRSKEFVESLDISQLHVFPYSERPNTKALTIDQVVSQEEKHRRTHTMLNISERKLRDFAGKYVGQTRPVLLEHPRPGQPMTGWTDNYIKVLLDEPEPLCDNRVVNVRLTSLLDDGEMRGQILI